MTAEFERHVQAMGFMHDGGIMDGGLVTSVESCMHPIVVQLQDALETATGSAADPAEIMDRPADWSVSPWSIWTLLSLIQHEDRQEWVGHIAETRLGAELEAMSVAGALAHPGCPQSGLVPDLTDWEYYFHGCGCCLTNRITAERIDVDFYDGSAEWVDDYFFFNYLESLKQPEWVEARLIELHPTLETICLAIDELREAGLLEKHSASKVVRVIPEYRELATLIDRLNSVCQSTKRRAAAGALLGDWQLAGIEKEDVTCREHWDACVAQREARLEQLWQGGLGDRLPLQAMCDLGRPKAKQMLLDALRQPPSGVVSAALDVICNRPDEDWSDEIAVRLRQTDPSGDIPQPHIWVTCAEYLLRREQHVDEVRRGFRRVGGGCLGDAALLALEFLPDLALDLFRRALRSGVPCDRTTAAAALAIVDQPWSRAELIAVLEESTDQEATAECRAALRALPHADLHQVVDDWEQRNPHEPETGPFISMTEMALRTRDSWIQYEMEKLHDRVIGLRSLDVPRPKRRSWWPF